MMQPNVSACRRAARATRRLVHETMLVLAVVLAAAVCALCGTRPNRSGDLSDHSLIPGWAEVGFDSCAGELIYAITRRPGRTTFKRPGVPLWQRLGRTQWACLSCRATVCYGCAPVVVHGSGGHVPSPFYFTY